MSHRHDATACHSFNFTFIVGLENDIGLVEEREDY